MKIHGYQYLAEHDRKRRERIVIEREKDRQIERERERASERDMQ